MDKLLSVFADRWPRNLNICVKSCEGAALKLPSRALQLARIVRGCRTLRELLQEALQCYNNLRHV